MARSWMRSPTSPAYMVLPTHGRGARPLALHTYPGRRRRIHAKYGRVRWSECGSEHFGTAVHLAFRGQMTGGHGCALYRRIDRVRPTMVLDELDARLHGEGGENLRAVLNTGFHRMGKITICVGDDHEDTDFNTFCPKVLGGIGRLWDTVASRSIPIRLRRATKEEIGTIRKIRGDWIADECRPYRRKLLRLANDIHDQVAGTAGALRPRRSAS